MPLSDTSYRRLSPTINMYSEEGTGDSGPDRHYNRDHTGDYLAPLASVEDLSRVNTPGGSPSPRPRQRHPALEDPNWEPPEDPSLATPRNIAEVTLEPGILTPLQDSEPFSEGPPDRYRLVFLTLVLHGVGTLMPWNMFITAKNYFVEYKLATADEDLNTYATNFLPYIGYASQIPNVIFNWLNIFIQMGGNLTTRIVWSILVEVVVFVVTVVLAMVDSSDWPGVFFWITIASVVILNVANGIYQNTVYGMAARLPFSYTGAVVLGSNISGTFTAIINIMAIAMAPQHQDLCDLLLSSPPCLSCWPVLTLILPCPSIVSSLFNVFMVFFVTLAVFPAVLADTCRTEENFPITPKYYQAVTCFLTFNMFAMLGNMLPALFTWPSPRFLCVPVLLRLFLIPAFVLCHFYPVKAVRIMPVLIDSDWAYWALSVVLGVTSGYYSSLAMMYCPRTVEPEHAPVAGMMGAASLITGIFSGIVFQIVCTYAVTNISFEIPGYEFPFRNCTNRMT
ncbi:hypothetical protein O3P69_020312 [Scylla paramamosain]|uniref:Equilibrative nucleoside transporter 1 n=1 Tax=Scylla paramamosain TaxID=85552 RepID=A0AAW0SKD8_SCYPA